MGVKCQNWRYSAFFMNSKCKRSSLRSQSRMRLFLWISNTVKAAFPNLWWWWKRHPFFPWKNWLRAEELFTLVALSNSEGREKRNITFPITMLYPSLIPKSWLKSREESSRDITICKTNHTNHTQTAQLSTLEHQSLAYEDKGGIELKKQMNFFGTNWSMVMHFLL